MTNEERFLIEGFPVDLCAACFRFRIEPEGASVDPTGQSEQEGNALCTVHRARATEGYCVLCARRAPWVSLFEGSGIGCCRPCFVDHYGEKQASNLEAKLDDLEGRQAA